MGCNVISGQWENMTERAINDINFNELVPENDQKVYALFRKMVGTHKEDDYLITIQIS